MPNGCPAGLVILTHGGGSSRNSYRNRYLAGRLRQGGWATMRIDLLWFSSAGDAVAGYPSFGGVWTVAGAPVCHPDRLPNVADELERAAAGQGARVVFFGAGTRLEDAYARRTD